MTVKICFFADARSEHTQRWVKEMADRGFETYVVSGREADLTFTKVLHLSGSAYSKLGWFRRVFEIRRLMGQIRPDIVHGHYITSYGFWAAASGICPLVLTAWGSDILVSPQKSRLVKQITAWALRKADYITADSEDVLDEISNYKPSATLEQVQWGVDLKRYRPRQPKEEVSKGITFVSLRSWEPLYNIDLILRAFSQLQQRNPTISAHLHLLGGGSQEAELAALAYELGITGSVTFHGRVGEDEMLSVLHESDISISVPDSDGTAMSLLESMAVGLPVIVSDLPANRQWIDEHGGQVIPVGDVDALAEAMVHLEAKQELRVAMGKRNRELIEHKANRKSEMDRMAGIYKALVQEKSS